MRFLYVPWREWQHRKEPEIVRLQENDFEKLTGKAQLSAFPVNGLARKLSRRISSGGTTGTPVVFYEYLWVTLIEMMYICTIFAEGGWHPFKRTLVLRGDQLNVPWRRFGRMLVVNSYSMHLHAEELREVVARFEPQWIYAYPSVMFSYIESVEGCSVRQVDGFLLGSEELLDSQFSILRRINPNANILEWYGMSEKACLAWRKNRRGPFRVFRSYAVLAALPAGNGFFEIVGSSRVQAPSRVCCYRTGDLVRLSEQNEILEVIGRSQDCAVAYGGKVLAFSQAIGSLHGDIWEGVSHWQFEQSEQGVLLLRLMLREDNIDARRIKARMEAAFARFKMLGLSVKVMIGEFEPQRSATGKRRYFIQKMSLPK